MTCGNRYFRWSMVAFLRRGRLPETILAVHPRFAATGGSACRALPPVAAKRQSGSPCPAGRRRPTITLMSATPEPLALLLLKPLLWCHRHAVPAVALATLAANPFPDATPEFFHDFAGAVNRAVGGAVRVETPYARLTKAEVVRLGADLPLEHTLSCAN